MNKDTEIHLTDRAHADLEAIYNYSLENFSSREAEKYLDDIEAALSLLQEHPGLLNGREQFSKYFLFYRVRQHYLVCSQLENLIFVLTIKHVNMDIPVRLSELEPSLFKEAEIFYQKLRAK